MTHGIGFTIRNANLAVEILPEYRVDYRNMCISIDRGGDATPMILGVVYNSDVLNEMLTTP